MSRSLPPHRLISGTNEKSAPLVVALHGMGMNEEIFERPLRPLFTLPAHFLLPRAPLALDPEDPDSKKASWYRYDGDQDRFLSELLRCERYLLDTIAKVEEERKFRPTARFLLGFSQGGYCGSFVALRNSRFFRGMVISGARVKTEVLEDALAEAAASGFTSLLCHALDDRSVPPEAAERSHRSLLEAKIPTELHHFDGGHTMTRKQIAVIREWLWRNGAA